MAELVFEDLEFEQKEDKILVRFLDNFYFEVDKKSLGQIAISKHKIDFKGLTKEKATETNRVSDASIVNKKENYSPYAGNDIPRNVYWGDTHLHTKLSPDANLTGTLLKL